MVKIKVKRLDERAVIPKYAHSTDMGMDITATWVEYDRTKDRFIYHTGLSFELPEGYGMLIFPRSSNSKTEAYLTNSVGVLDAGYRGELMFVFKNRDKLKSEDSAWMDLAPYKAGDRIGQIIIIPYPKIEFEEVEELSETERGEGGFGSTGR